MPECRDVHESVFPSGDGVHDAVLAHQYCGGDIYWIDVRNNRAWFGGNTKVFLTWEFAPTVAWGDSQHIVITINEVSDIGTSLHEADRIIVIYRLADRLSDENFRNRINEYEARTQENLRAHKSTFTGNPAQDAQALKDVVDREWQNYRKLQEWARVNVQIWNSK